MIFYAPTHPSPLPPIFSQFRKLSGRGIQCKGSPTNPQRTHSGKRCWLSALGGGSGALRAEGSVATSRGWEKFAGIPPPASRKTMPRYSAGLGVFPIVLGIKYLSAPRIAEGRRISCLEYFCTISHRALVQTAEELLIKTYKFSRTGRCDFFSFSPALPIPQVNRLSNSPPCQG